ncbi:MAG: Gfo/Idh/MocA family oxidoreductase [Litorilinea sp.]
MTKIRMAQYGTKHGHAAGKLLSMLNHPDIEVVGVYEPDAARRAEVANSDDAFGQVTWFESADAMLNDASITAIASEGLNSESLNFTEAIVDAGKHVWYDKPAGDNWTQWQRVVEKARAQELFLQMGYMFRHQHAFEKLAQWAKSGALGQIFSVRAHMSTRLNEAQRAVISEHAGGILYDLGGHMIDQVVWLLGRPQKVTAYLRNDGGIVPAFQDNTLAVFEFERALATIDIAAMESRPMARRFEIYGDKGSAIIVDGFDPSREIRLALEEDIEGYAAGVHYLQWEPQTRQNMYDRELEAFVEILRGERAPDRSYDHDLLVQETLLRATGGITEDSSTV